MSKVNPLKNLRDLRINTDPSNPSLERSSTRTSLNRSPYLARISPNLTPKDRLRKLLDKASPLTERLSKPNISQEKSLDPQTERNSRSPAFGSNSKVGEKSTEDKSDDLGKKLLDTAQGRKFLEEQCRLMENRVKHLMDESNKIRGKIKQTRMQTQNMIKRRQKILTEEEKTKKHQMEIEKEINEKKEKAAEMRLQNEKKRREKQEQLLKDKARIALEVKMKKAKDLEKMEEIRKEEEIRKNERIWKIALHEKELENSKIYQRIQARDTAKKMYDSRIEDEEKKAGQVEKRIKELEQIESRLVEDLKNTHMCHVKAFEEMEKIFTSPIESARDFSNSISPYRGQLKKQK